MADDANAAAQASTNAADQANTQAPAAGDKPAANAAPAADDKKPVEGAAKPGDKVAEGKDGQQQVKTDDKKPTEIVLKAPDGSKLSKAHMDKLTADAKAKGMNQADAQAMVDRDHGLLSEYQRSQEAEFKQQSETWKQEAADDAELGGTEHSHKVEIAHRAVKAFASEDFIKDLESTGLGNHPELIRTFYRIGKAMEEDKIKGGGNKGGAQKKSPEEILYPNN